MKWDVPAAQIEFPSFLHLILQLKIEILLYDPFQFRCKYM